MEHSTHHAIEASVGVEPEMGFEVFQDGIWITGTAAQLVAERVLPSDLILPLGRRAKDFMLDGFECTIHRARPPWWVGEYTWQGEDWWRVDRRDQRVTYDRDSLQMKEIERHAKKIAFARSDAGARQSAAYWRAHSDEAYRLFKATIPGLIPLRRGRKPKQAATN